VGIPPRGGSERLATEVYDEAMLFRTSSLLGLAVAATALSACSKEASPSDSQLDTAPAGVELAAAATPPTTGTLKGLPGDSPTAANACLLAFQANNEAALSLEQAAALSGRPAAEAKVKSSKVMSAAHHDISYSWPSPRKRKIKFGANEMEGPRPDLVSFGGVVPMTREYFINSYRPIEKAEKAQLDRGIEKAADEKLKDASHKKVAQDLGGTLANITKSFRAVEGLGEAASYNGEERVLYVLDRGIRFRVSADLSEDVALNEAKAIELARRVMGACP